MKKRLVIGLLILFLASVCDAGGVVTILVDGASLRTTPKAVIRGGAVFIPVTAFRKIGLAVETKSKTHAWVGWPESDCITDFYAGKTYAEYGEGSKKKLPGAPFIRQGVLMVPLRSMLDKKDVGTSLTGEWDAKSRVVRLHRSKRWLDWRLEKNESLRKEHPSWYSEPILGK